MGIGASPEEYALVKVVLKILPGGRERKKYRRRRRKAYWTVLTRTAAKERGLKNSQKDHTKMGGGLLC